MFLANLVLISSILTGSGTMPAPPDSGEPISQHQNAALLAFLNRAYDEQVALSPETETELGRKIGYDRLDDYTGASELSLQKIKERQLVEMQASFDLKTLDDNARINYRLFRYDVESGRESIRFRNLRFAISTNNSPAGDIPASLINSQIITTESDASAYTSRIREVERVMREITETMRKQASAGVIPNKVVFAAARSDAKRVITGFPFDDGPDSPVMEDFRKKVSGLSLSQSEKMRLVSAAELALKGPFYRGYIAFIKTLDQIEPLSTGNYGAWHLPNGAAFYAQRLRYWTTTDLSADQIHELGLQQVASCREEMEKVKRQLGFVGSLDQFFTKLRTDMGPQFKYPNTDAGRQQYLSDARAVIASVMAVAPQYFRVLPKTPLEVRAVERWREKTSTTAFYNPASADGARPGIVYFNLVDLAQTQKIQVASIAAHEGAPGHHFQFARQMELADLPMFRLYTFYGAYGEGWGLYSERLADEMGVYKDAYARFGMLSLQIWRAIRLVLDTGIHAKKWTRQQAVDYFHANSSVSDGDIAREVDRYFNDPGQATAYMVGELKILSLRRRAERELGPRFDIRDFHEAVLSHGALPLDVLDEEVSRYISAKQR